MGIIVIAHKALAAVERLFDATDIRYIKMKRTFMDYFSEEDIPYTNQILRLLEESDFVLQNSHFYLSWTILLQMFFFINY